MCTECEKSLPNQIVFDKIEYIIRLMQDEQNGLPVKTAKSFMSKIPSVFTGIDLIQWMMRNLKLEDQQEAMHLANLIASHGYIFPIEDHTLSIKNDCTFYRFQTPCLWPSNNSDPENTDYAVYLCKRTMQGKTRLELADYEAENLARLQKMFSRKWEFIFMQAESQAKVDKKRDKLERKVLDSQERAFWDVYRPVPGCVNTTELDIKKACRLSKSAKRCGECQKVAASLSVPASTSSTSTSPLGPVSNNEDVKLSSSSSQTNPTPSSSGKSVQIVEKVNIAEVKHAQPITSSSNVAKVSLDLNVSLPTGAEIKSDTSLTQLDAETKTEETNKNLEISDEQRLALAKKAMGEGKIATSCLKQSTSLIQNNSAKNDSENQSTSSTSMISKTSTTAKGTVGHHHHHHQHPHHSHHHHHHHHHHHPHSHQHGHHHHHHQCAHHKHHQASSHKHHHQAQKLSMPTDSIITTTVTASPANWAASKNDEHKQSSSTTGVGSDKEEEEDPKEEESEKKDISSDHEDQTNQNIEAGTSSCNDGGISRAQTWSKKRSVGSVDCHHAHLMRAPSVNTTLLDGSRRKSECNRMLSMSENTTTDFTGDSPSHHNIDLSKNPANLVPERPSSACCSNSIEGKSLNKSPESRHTAQCKGQRSIIGQPQTVLRKSSLNIIARPSSTGSEFINERQEDCLPSSSNPVATSSTTALQSSNPHKSTTQGQHHSPLKGAKSLACDQLTSDLGEDRQHIGDLERELKALKVRLDRRIGGVKMSKVTQSYLSYFKQWADYDPFIAQPIPSNPWISDSTELWDSERQTKDVHCRRVRRWAFSLKELLNDPAGREQFHRFLEKEFSAENLKFWDAVQELKRVHSRDVARRVEAIWTEYLAQDANCPINIDSKSYETSKKNMAKNKNNRYIFDEAAGHVYQLMKNDSYPRYLRSEMYKDYKEASEKKRNQVAFDVFKPQITTLKHKFNF